MKINPKRFLKLHVLLSIFLVIILYRCGVKHSEKAENQSGNISASEILGNPEYLAISYGGYRTKTRKDQPTVEQIMEDMKLLQALGVKILRTYNTHLDQAENILKAIDQLQAEDPDFQMYVMLGSWIKCKNAETDFPDHSQEDSLANQAEIQRAVKLAQTYPKIVKILAVGNEAMVHWATGYFVEPAVILRWVNYLQELKKQGALTKDIWITSSDNFASWGGGSPVYHTSDLNALIQAVDYVSMHTYAMHDTHYNPEFWGLEQGEQELSKFERNERVMERAVAFSISQFNSTEKYIHSISKNKPVHIGETGWSTASNELFGADGSHAADELKAGLYFKKIRAWTSSKGISCFYFEAFDEIWKDASNPGGSENHFGLFTVDAKAKYALWDYFDLGAFNGLSRDGKPIEKTFDGRIDSLFQEVHEVPLKTK